MFVSKGVSDGAGALILASEDAVKKHNLTPLARVVGYFVSGCDPTIMGIGKSVGTFWFSYVSGDKSSSAFRFQKQ